MAQPLLAIRAVSGDMMKPASESPPADRFSISARLVRSSKERGKL